MVFQPKSLRGFHALNTTLFLFVKCLSPLPTSFTQTEKPSEPAVLIIHLVDQKFWLPFDLFTAPQPMFQHMGKVRVQS